MRLAQFHEPLHILPNENKQCPEIYFKIIRFIDTPVSEVSLFAAELFEYYYNKFVMRAKDLTTNINCHLIRDVARLNVRFKSKYSEIVFAPSAAAQPAFKTS